MHVFLSYGCLALNILHFYFYNHFFMVWYCYYFSYMMITTFLFFCYNICLLRILSLLVPQSRTVMRNLAQRRSRSVPMRPMINIKRSSQNTRFEAQWPTDKIVVSETANDGMTLVKRERLHFRKLVGLIARHKVSLDLPNFGSLKKRKEGFVWRLRHAVPLLQWWNAAKNFNVGQVLEKL